MRQYFKKVRHLGIPLYAYSSTVSFVLLCLCIMILLAFFFVSKEVESTRHKDYDFTKIPKIVKYQIETLSAPLFALGESHIAKYDNIHEIVNDQELREEFVHVHAPTFRFSSQVYNIAYLLEDGTTIFFVNLEHINRLSMTNTLSSELKRLIQTINPPEFTKYLLFTSPPHDTSQDISDISAINANNNLIMNVANQVGRLEFYGGHGELIEARTGVKFIDTNSFPYYEKTINARTYRISRPYMSHLAKAPALTLSYPIRENMKNNTLSKSSHERFKDRYAGSEQVIKGVYAVTMHFDPTLLHNDMVSPSSSIFILDDNLSSVVSAQPAPRDVPLLEKCHANTIINGTHIVHKHDPIFLMQGNQKSFSLMMQDFLEYNKDQGVAFREKINTVNFNGYDFDYYFTSANVFGKKLNLLVWDRPLSTDSGLTFFDIAIFFVILVLILIACNFYIIYRKTIAVVALAAEARRLANYDFSAPDSIVCHSSELIGLHRSLATIRLILIDAFANSPYKSAIKFDNTEDEPKKKYSVVLPKEDLDTAIATLENDFINGKFTEEQYIQAKLYYKQKALKAQTLLMDASEITGSVQNTNAQMESESDNFIDGKISDNQIDKTYIDFNEYNDEDFVREELVDGGYYIHRRETPKKENTLLPHSGVTPPIDRRVEDRRKPMDPKLYEALKANKNFVERRKKERRNTQQASSEDLEKRIAQSKEEASSLVQSFDTMFSKNLLSSTQKKQVSRETPSQHPLQENIENQQTHDLQYNLSVTDAQFKPGIIKTKKQEGDENKA